VEGVKMADFEEIAKRAKEKADAQEAAEAKAFADSSDRVSAGQAVLVKAVLPILARAKEAIQKTVGVPCFIEPKFGVGVKPHVVFRCAGPPQNNLSGRKSEPQSAPAYFDSVDGTTVGVRIGNPNAPGQTEPLGSAGVQDAEELVEKAVEAILASYYEQVANLRRSELLR
jgi:hypothetical protein